MSIKTRVAASLAGLVCLLGVVACSSSTSHGARHVVLVVWDGMRPDMVSETNSPSLWKLGREGVTFRNHHSAYPSATNINGTVMATGMQPGHSGLIANMEFRSAINAGAPFDTADAASIDKGDALPGSSYLLVPTIAELLHSAGQRTAIAGTKTVATLFDRPAQRSSVAAKDSPVVAMGHAQPADIAAALRNSLGAFPPKQTPNAPQDEWTVRALVDTFWQDDVPPFSVLWLSDPDFAQHDTAPGSPAALAGIRNSDAHLAQVLAALEAKGVRDDTDIFVVSDHGFSTVDRSVDVPALLNNAGFEAVKEFTGERKPGTILVVGNGGTVLFYITGSDPAVARRLVEWLQQTDFAGVIFAEEEFDGAFTFSDAHLEKSDGSDAPDVVMAFRWNDQPNEFAVPGMINADWNRAAGKGTHATLSKFDIHNTLLAAGPDLRRGFLDELPTGNVDLAPTILKILDVDAGEPFDGRVLAEALKSGDQKPAETRSETMRTERNFGSSRWRQYLKISQVGEYRYFDEGNGSASAD